MQVRPANTLNIGPRNNQATKLVSKVTSVVGKRGLISMKLQRMGDDKTEQGKFMRDLLVQRAFYHDASLRAIDLISLLGWAGYPFSNNNAGCN